VGGFSTQDTMLHCKSILSFMLIILNCIDDINQIKKKNIVRVVCVIKYMREPHNVQRKPARPVYTQRSY